MSGAKVRSVAAVLDRWYAAGAELPTLALPPNRPLAELEYMLESLAPTATIDTSQTGAMPAPAP